MSSSIRQVSLVAAREMEVGFRSKQFYVSMGVSLVLIVAIILLPRLFGGGMTSTSVVSVDGTAEQRAVFLELVDGTPGFVFLDADDAQGVDADLNIDLDSERPRVEATYSSELVKAGGLIPYVQLVAEREHQSGGGASVPDLTPETVFLEDDSGRGARIALAYVLSILLFLQIAGLGSSVAQGTLEEKGNRVVDVLFPKLPPTRMLVGKVLGIGLFGAVQMLLLGAVGVLTVLWAGEEAIRGDIVPAVAVSLGWFVLGYLFIGFLSGSVASTVTQPEQLSTVMLPLQLLNGAVFVTAVLSLQAVESTWVRMLSMLPPFSAILMPIRVAAGTVPWSDVLIAVAIAILAILACLAVGGRVYRRSVVGRSLHVPSRATEGG
ncbi:ABC transporter permease [Microbacterium sp. NPDC012755]|uniref:ABC transporter permease n=1 Tax=Microbacterium sp. NPDC012755 TaxID=3364184 RepID=UPI0036C1C492